MGLASEAITKKQFHPSNEEIYIVYGDLNELMKMASSTSNEPLNESNMIFSLKHDSDEIMAICHISTTSSSRHVMKLNSVTFKGLNNHYTELDINTFKLWGYMAHNARKLFENEVLEKSGLSWDNKTPWYVRTLNPYTSAPFPLKLYSRQ